MSPPFYAKPVTYRDMCSGKLPLAVIRDVACLDQEQFEELRVRSFQHRLDAPTTYSS